MFTRKNLTERINLGTGHSFEPECNGIRGEKLMSCGVNVRHTWSLEEWMDGMHDILNAVGWEVSGSIDCPASIRKKKGFLDPRIGTGIDLEERTIDKHTQICCVVFAKEIWSTEWWSIAKTFCSSRLGSLTSQWKWSWKTQQNLCFTRRRSQKTKQSTLRHRTAHVFVPHWKRECNLKPIQIDSFEGQFLFIWVNQLHWGKKKKV